MRFLALLIIGIVLTACSSIAVKNEETKIHEVTPVIITEKVKHDTDDPAIWINKENPEQSLILGTDKDKNGGLYVFDLNGKIIQEKTILNLKRPNNVDIAYGLILNGKPVDIAVVTERITHSLRIFSLPDMQPLDLGGIPMFEGETLEEYRDVMGIALYTNPSTNDIHAIVGRKSGEDGAYLWQYQLSDDSTGNVKATLLRKFGKYSGNKEIEAIAVDNELGYIYYSDETVGVRKYYADPAKGNEELALFATNGFARDHEGISIYKSNDTDGYIIVSDQQANRFHIFSREGSDQHPHDHQLIKIIHAKTDESDGNEVSNVALGKQFPKGLFVAMSTDKTFQLYSWEDIAGEELDSYSSNK